MEETYVGRRGTLLIKYKRNKVGKGMGQTDGRTQAPANFALR